MNRVDFFGNKVTRLILGDNPFNGHSYITDQVSGKDMTDFYTFEKIMEALFETEEMGINTIIPLADPYIIRLLKEYRRNGGKMNVIFQPYVAMNQDVSMRQMMEVEPIGIYHQGTTTDFNFETGKNDKTRAMIEKYHEMGIPVGLGTHIPEVIKTSEEEGWNVDFYMACLQNARRGRRGEQSGFLTGKSKAKLIFYPEDRPVMLDLISKVEKPVIAFKIFAGGQMFAGKTEPEIREIIKGVYEEVFIKIKPNDFAAIGVFQRDKDQIKENVELYEEWYNAKK